MADEPNRWYQQFERYRLLGPTRSLLAAYNQWRIEKSRKASTSCTKSWRVMAEQWRWQARAEAWDKHCSDQASARAEAERVEVLASGFAQRHARVRALDELAQLLLEDTLEGLRGMNDKRWFSAAQVRELRGLLDDLAAEMGERVKRADITSAGKAIKAYTVLASPDDWDDER